MPLWVFGYGSLLWNPGFEPVRAIKATLSDYHRSFCMLSIHHRGTVEEPGLVLALDRRPEASCCGIAFEVKAGEEEQVLAYLRDRELVSSAYLETTETVELAEGGPIEAVTYVIDPDHEQYCHFDLETQAQMIARAIGGRGPNTEYLYNTAIHLEKMGIADKEMAWLVERVRKITG